MTPAADVVVCGAGMAGIAAAYHLAARHGVRRVVLVDERPPLSLTSDKSTEAYRNFWPGPDDAMVRFMNRSIDLLEGLAEASGNVFRMNRRGYVFGTSDPSRARELRETAELVAGWGAGPFRIHDGCQGAPAYPPPSAGDWRAQPTGIDLLLDRPLIRRHFPYIADDTVALLHARRCGWLSGQQLGMHLLELARRAGAELIEGRLAAVDVAGGRVTGVRIEGPQGRRTFATERLVLAAGPLLPEAARLLGITLPVFSEQHYKIAIEDTLGAVPRDAPFLIWDDAQTLGWSPEERAALEAEPGLRWMLEPFPAGVHTRPEGASPESRTLLVLWSYDAAAADVVFPMPDPPLLHRARPPRDGAHAAPLRRLSRPDAARLRRRRLLREDPREPPADRPPAGDRRLRVQRVLGLRHHGGLRRGRAGRRPRHGIGAAGLRARLRALPLRRPRVHPAHRGV